MVRHAGRLTRCWSRPLQASGAIQVAGRSGSGAPTDDAGNTGVQPGGGGQSVPPVSVPVAGGRSRKARAVATTMTPRPTTTPTFWTVPDGWLVRAKKATVAEPYRAASTATTLLRSRHAAQPKKGPAGNASRRGASAHPTLASTHSRDGLVVAGWSCGGSAAEPAGVVVTVSSMGLDPPAPQGPTSIG